MMKRINPFNLINHQYKMLKYKFNLTGDLEKRKVLSKRLINLIAVMEFLLSLNGLS